MHRSNPGDKTTPAPDYTAPPPGDISDLAHLLRSPPSVPCSPAPAYTALPHRDVDFHLAPLINGRVGDIELETTDGKRFLVHRKVLEQETVFFPIYYGFVPVWRLATPHLGPPHPNIPSSPPPLSTTGAINNLLCLPRFIASHIRATTATNTTSPTSSHSDRTSLLHNESDTPPAPPPKDVTAPTPTFDPYAWAVPEPSSILASFLSLIYPRDTFCTSPMEALPSLDITCRVIRAAMGYQSSKALNIARDRLHHFVSSQPVEVYGMACFFKFTDLARIASQHAIAVHPDEWSKEAKSTMGRTGLKHLLQLREIRMAGLRGILNGHVESDEHHSSACVRRGMIEILWRQRADQVKEHLEANSELLELLEIDLRGGHCGDCLVNLGTTIQRCILAARDLPKTI